MSLFRHLNKLVDFPKLMGTEMFSLKYRLSLTLGTCFLKKSQASIFPPILKHRVMLALQFTTYLQPRKKFYVCSNESGVNNNVM